MTKRIIGVFLTLFIIGSCYSVAYASSSSFPQQSLETSLSGSVSNLGALVLKSNGDLWYFPNYTKDSNCVMQNVSAFVHIYDSWFCVLLENRELWSIFANPFTVDIKMGECLDTNVEKLGAAYDICYLKTNGELFYIPLPEDWDCSSLSKEFIADKVISFADERTYITSDHVLHYQHPSSEKADQKYTASGFSQVYCSTDYLSPYFAISDQGDLYSWGYNSSGETGCGTQYDYATLPPFDLNRESPIAEVYLYVIHPTRILDNVSSVYSTLYGNYAWDKNGQLWKWGDSPTSAHAPKKGKYVLMDKIVLPDANYCTPRLSNNSEFLFEKVNGIRIASDGTLQTIGIGGGVARELPLTLDDVKKTSVSNQQPSTDTATTGFTDVVEASYYYQPVKWAVELGITNGTSETTFSPDQLCTQSQIITFLWRAAGSPQPSAKTNPFDNIAQSSYYYNAALWAYEEGIISAKSFLPDDPCTRAQAVEFMWLHADKPFAPQSTFTDIQSGVSYASAVAWAVERGITTGTSASTFSPEKVCTRAQIMTFLYRAFA